MHLTLHLIVPNKLETNTHRFDSKTSVKKAPNKEWRNRKPSFIIFSSSAVIRFPLKRWSGRVRSSKSAHAMSLYSIASIEIGRAERTKCALRNEIEASEALSTQSAKGRNVRRADGKHPFVNFGSQPNNVRIQNLLFGIKSG